MKVKKLFSLVALTAGITVGLTSCGGTTKSNALNIVCLNASYGRDWIDQIVSNFKETHPDVEINLKAEYDAEAIIEKNLASSRNTDDLYISVGAVWKEYAAQGKFLDLTDFLQEQVDGVSIENKVADEFKNSIKFKRSNGEEKCYRLPFTSGIGGIYYNKKMFSDNNWTVPSTFDELIELCNTISNAKIPVAGDILGKTNVKPLVYGGTDTDYFDYAVFNWWSQLAGIDNIKEFLKYESYENFDASKNDTYAALKSATTYWKQLFSNNNYDSSNNNLSASDAQKDFINGKAAMMFNGDWLYNDTLVYTTSGAQGETFELGYMKTPTLPGVSSENANNTYIIGEDQYIAIPVTSSHKELAKDFIKEIISDRGCEVFLNKANGFLAYNADYSKMDIQDNFLREMIDFREKLTNNKFTSFSSNRKYLIGAIDVWCTGGSRPFLSLLNGAYSSYANPIDEAFSRIANLAKSKWDDWTNLAA